MSLIDITKPVSGNPTTQSVRDNFAAAAAEIDALDSAVTILQGSVSGFDSHLTDTNNPHAVTKTQIGLGNVDNTSDANKPISTATQTALNSKADSSALSAHVVDTGNPHSTTAAQIGAAPTSRTITTTAPLTGGGDLSADRTLAISAATTIAAGSMSAADKTKLDAITGTNTGDQTNITGNAGTATALQTARNINGVAFDGTANITINAVDSTARVAKAGDTMTGALNWAATQTIASAATTDIGAATSNSVIVSGTTTITGLGTIAAGAERVVQFSGALTLTHNATSLILPGGANINTAAGDVAYFVSLGSGNWRCTGYQKANGQAVVGSGGSGDFKSDGTVAMTGAIQTTVGTMTSSVANGASAVGFDFNTASLTTSGALLFRVKNNGTTAMSLNKDSVLTVPQLSATSVTVNTTTGAGSTPLAITDSAGPARSLKFHPYEASIEAFSTGSWGTTFQFAHGGFTVTDSGITGNKLISHDTDGLHVKKITSSDIGGAIYNPLTLTANYYPSSTVTPAIKLTVYDTAGTTDQLAKVEIFNGDTGGVVMQRSGGNVGIGMTPAQKLDVSGNIQSTGYQRTAPVTVATLTAAATAGAGARHAVTDSTVATAGNVGATVVGGGSNTVSVFCTGAAWIIC